MLGMEFNRAGDLFVAMSSSDPETHGIWRVSRDGSSTERFSALDTAGFPNGLAFDSAGDLYVSDTTRGGIWKIDQQGDVETWSDDPILRGIIPPVSPLGISLGANGLAFDPGEQNLYVAVMEFGRIVRIPVNPDGSAGQAEVFTEEEGKLYDGVAFDQAGNLYVADLGQDSISVISPAGDTTVLAQGGGLQNPSDVKFGVGEGASTLYIANFNLLRMIGLVPETPRPALHKMAISGQVGLPRIQTAPLPTTAQGPAIPQDKGYLVEEIGDGLYWVTDGTYQVMFLTTGEGVVAVDAPPNLGDKYLRAIAEVTDEPITHVVYSHYHKDHIAAASMFPADATYIAQDETAAQLALRNDPNRPLPTVTFADSYTLSLGGQTLQLEYRGADHVAGNIYIYAPRQKVLMKVDIISPGWAPFKSLGIAEDVPGYIQSHDEMLSYDFDTFIGGHRTRLGTREDVEIAKEYILDIQTNAARRSRRLTSWQ